MWTILIIIIGAFLLYISLNGNHQLINTNTATNATLKLSPINNNSQSTTTSYSLSDVATHNNESGCWTIVNGKIYDITSFISSHPAGVNKILQGCGVDATSMYERVGAHDISKLSNSFVGNLN